MPNRQKFSNLEGQNGADTSVQQGASSESASGADAGEGEGASQDGPDDKKPEPKYTDAEVDALISKRIARERAKMEREIREGIERQQAEKQTEAERLKGMTDLQRAQHDAKKLAEERDALKARIELSDQMAVARHELGEAGISMGDELLGMFVSADADKTLEAIESLKKLWPEAVNAAVQHQLKRKPPEAERENDAPSFGASFAESYSKKKNPNGGK